MVQCILTLSSLDPVVNMPVPEAVGDMEALAEGEGKKKMNAFIQIENMDKKFLCNQTLSGKSPFPGLEEDFFF